MLKDPRLMSVLNYLRERLGERSFQVEDHWEADLMATGIRSLENPRGLAYVAVNGDDRFTVIIEADAPDGSVGEEIANFECGSLEDVCRAIQDFLAIERGA